MVREGYAGGGGSVEGGVRRGGMGLGNDLWRGWGDGNEGGDWRGGTRVGEGCVGVEGCVEGGRGHLQTVAQDVCSAPVTLHGYKADFLVVTTLGTGEDTVEPHGLWSHSRAACILLSVHAARVLLSVHADALTPDREVGPDVTFSHFAHPGPPAPASTHLSRVSELGGV